LLRRLARVLLQEPLLVRRELQHPEPLRHHHQAAELFESYFYCPKAWAAG